LNSVELGGIVFLCLFGAASVGLSLSPRMPKHHLSAESKDAIRLTTAIVGTLSALALGLLIASAKSAYDTADAEMKTSAGNVVLLDRVMAHYGSDTLQGRGQLRKLLDARLSQFSGDGASGAAAVVEAGVEPVQDQLRALTPRTDSQRWLQSRALDVSGRIAEGHWLLVETGNEGLPWPFLVVLVFWLAVLFATFGLLAPSNATVLIVLFVSALSVAGAVFLIVDMDNPYLGLIRISDTPLRDALQQLGRS
jgi:hypothetical protein